MKLFWIGYDLMAPGKDHTRLHQALGSLGAQDILISDWVLKTNYTYDLYRRVVNSSGRSRKRRMAALLL